LTGRLGDNSMGENMIEFELLQIIIMDDLTWISLKEPLWIIKK
jgi:hypothetical protein